MSIQVKVRATFVPVRVGQDDPDSPRYFLVADQNDIDQGETNGDAYTEALDGTQRSGILPLQQFYKFGIWYPYEEGG